MRSMPAPGIRFLRSFPRDSWYRGLILLLTFLCYTSYHLSRKPISIVKSELHYNCSSRGANPHNDSNSTTWCDWKPFDQDNYKELFGALDNAFLVAYAIGMYISGVFGERLPLRYYLSGGMLLSGLFTALFGLGYYWQIHYLWYFVIIQVCNGLVQTTGWPSVVTCIGNWFGKGKYAIRSFVWQRFLALKRFLFINLYTRCYMLKKGEETLKTEPWTILCLISCAVAVSCLSSKKLRVTHIIIFVLMYFIYILPFSPLGTQSILHHSLLLPFYPHNNPVRRGLIMGIWNSHTSVGNILGSLIAGAWVSEAWGLSFIVPGIIIAAMGVICFLFLIEYPEEVDCSPPLHHASSEEKGLEAEHSIGDGSLNVSNNSKENIIVAVESTKESTEGLEAISFLGALRIPGVVEFSFCLLFAKLVSYTFLYWLPLYIVNVAHFSAKKAGDMSTLFDVGGIIGGILAGLISDYTGGRATTCCVMLILAAPMLFLYNYIGQNGLATSIVMLIICGGLVNGPYALITTAVSADLGTHECLQGNAKALSTVSAIIDGTGSVGAALGPLLAGLISQSGWDNVFYMLISADILACLLLSRVVYKEIRGWCGCYTRKRGFKEF